MIETVNYIANNGILISGIANGKEYDIKFDEIRSYWDYATEDDFEGGTAKPFGDKILFTVLTASSQGGIVVLWDVPKRAIEHISECSYSVAVDIHNNDIYSLHCVSNYNMTANFKLYKIQCGIKDIGCEGTLVKCEIPDVLNKFSGCLNDIDLKISEGNIFVVLSGEEYELKK